MDLDYVQTTNNIIELHRIVAAARSEGLGELERAAQARLQSFARPHASAPAPAVPETWKGYADATQLGSSVSAAASEAFVQRSTSHPLVASFAPGASLDLENSTILDMYAPRYLTPLEKTREGYLRPPRRASRGFGRPSTAEAAAVRAAQRCDVELGRFGFGSTSPQRPRSTLVKEPPEENLPPALPRPGTGERRKRATQMPSSPERFAAEVEAASIVGLATRSAAGATSRQPMLPSRGDGSPTRMPVDHRGAIRLFPEVLEKSEVAIWKAPERKKPKAPYPLSFFRGEDTEEERKAEALRVK